MVVASRTLSPAEAQAKVEELYELAHRLYGDLIGPHPVVQAIERGSLPREALKAFALNWYCWGYPISYGYAEVYKRFTDYFKRFSDMEDVVTLEIARELSQPVLGGRPHVLEDFAVAVGNTKEELLSEPYLYPETAGFRDFIRRLYVHGTFAEVAAIQVGNILPRFARQLVAGLSTHYGLDEKALSYWQVYIDVDDRGAMQGGGALGSVASNKYLLKRVLEVEPLVERVDFGVDYVAEMSVRLLKVLLSGIKKHFWDKTGYGA